MKVVKVDATSSTNTFLKEFIKTDSDKEMFCVMARHQFSGKGQRGAVWVSDAGKNLTFSVYLPGIRHIQKDTFKLSALVAIGLKEVLSTYDIPKLSIKWPNDILSRQLKIGGILIENMITQHKEGASIIGVGLNVNQTSFANLPKASSLKAITSRSYNLDELLADILLKFEKIPDLFNSLSYNEVITKYYASLFKFKSVSMFQLPDGSLLQGIIKGVDNHGRLIVEFEEDRLDSFDIKEIQIKY